MYYLTCDRCREKTQQYAYFRDDRNKDVKSNELICKKCFFDAFQFRKERKDATQRECKICGEPSSEDFTD